MKKILFLFSIISILFISFSVKASNLNDSLIINAKSGILIEQSTKEVLYEKDMDRRLSPASMTKIMTLLLVYEAMENERFNKTTILTASNYASSMGGSQIYLKENEKITVDEALKCVCIASANDCAVLLAEEVSGSEAAFVREMNEKVSELGLLNTNFSDCTGLSSDNHYTSAYDLAMISRELIIKYPDVLNYTNIKEDYIRENTSSPFWLVNTNKLIGRVEGLNGLKTGYTSFSGYCITLSMSKDNMDLISVVFGYDNSVRRNVESLELLKYGFNNYKLDTIVKKDTVLFEIDHILFKDKIKLYVDDDINYLTKKNESFNYRYDYIYYKDSYNGVINVYIEDNLILSDEINSEVINKRNVLEITFEFLRRVFT